MILAESKMLLQRRKGEDGFKSFSVRLREDTVAKLDDIASQTGKSRNELVAACIDFALDHCEIVG